MRCKFCGKYEGESVPFNGIHFVHYGKRGAYAHLRCLAVGKGSDFVLALPTYTLEKLPYMQVRELGFEAAMRTEMQRRGAASV